jgi:CRP-like cAMP-binding protein
VITAELLRPFPLFDGVPMHELHAIADRAADIDLRAGDWLISEGEEAAFFGLLTGRLEVLKDLGGEPQRIKVYHANETFGEIPLLLDAPSVASLRAQRRARSGSTRPTFVRSCSTAKRSTRASPRRCRAASPTSSRSQSRRRNPR